MEFEWDPAKTAENLRKHGVSFREAATVFGDFLGSTAADPDHSTEERWFITVGRSQEGRLLLVGACGTWRTDPNHQCPKADP